MPLAPIMISGVSGNRKSTSLGGLDPISTFIIRATRKAAIPTRKNLSYKELNTADWTGNTCVVTEPIIKIKDDNGNVNYIPKILTLYPKLVSLGFKTIVIDDVQILLSSIESSLRADIEFTNKRQIYSVIKTYINSLINVTQSYADKCQAIIIWQKLPDKDQLVIPGDYFNEVTIPQGSFDMILMAEIQPEGGSMFKTNGQSLARTPYGMFEEQYVQADIKYVIDEAYKYFGITT